MSFREKAAWISLGSGVLIWGFYFFTVWSRLADAPGGILLPAAPGAFAEAVAKSGVSAAGLGTGYVAFFIYSAALGAAGVILTLMVAGREARRRREPGSGDQAPA